MSGDVRVGLDVGGTFTDLVCWDGGTGRFALRKVPTTPADIAAGILQALAAALPPGATGAILTPLDGTSAGPKYCGRILADRSAAGPVAGVPHSRPGVVTRSAPSVILRIAEGGRGGPTRPGRSGAAPGATRGSAAILGATRWSGTRGERCAARSPAGWRQPQQVLNPEALEVRRPP